MCALIPNFLLFNFLTARRSPQKRFYLCSPHLPTAYPPQTFFYNFMKCNFFDTRMFCLFLPNDHLTSLIGLNPHAHSLRLVLLCHKDLIQFNFSNILFGKIRTIYLLIVALKCCLFKIWTSNDISKKKTFQNSVTFFTFC